MEQTVLYNLCMQIFVGLQCHKVAMPMWDDQLGNHLVSNLYVQAQVNTDIYPSVNPK